MMVSTDRILKSLKSKPEQRTAIGTDIYLPNHSGDLSAGRVLKTPTTSTQPVNKSYVDDEIASSKPTTLYDSSGNSVAIADSTKLEVSEQLSITGASRFSGTVGAQSIPHETTTLIKFTTETWDNLSEYNTTTGVFTATQAGYYLVMAALWFESYSWGAGSFCQLQLFKNSSNYQTYPRVTAFATTTFAMSIQGLTIVYLDADDTCDMRIYHNSGAGRTLSASTGVNRMTIHRLS